jgi:dUTP pyrophosphatase
MEFSDQNNRPTDSLNGYQDMSLYIFNNTGHDRIMYLNIYIENDDNLKNIYLEAAEKHNKKLFEDPHFFDAGFDLYLPRTETLGLGTSFFKPTINKKINKVDFKIKCSAKMHLSNDTFFYTGFYLHPRSSLSKTPLRLANSTGIIDAGYRGPIIGMFDVLYKETDTRYDCDCDWYENANSRLLQICGPSLCPIFVRIVDTVEELGPSTLRGEGGFGSTGK